MCVLIALLIVSSLLIMGSVAIAQAKTTPDPENIGETLKAAEQEAEQRGQLPKKEGEATHERQKRLLQILTAENGTNPTAIVGRFQLSKPQNDLNM